MKQGRVAAIVVTHNRCQLLCRWLQCMQRQTVAPHEVVVVDNGSTDETRALLRDRFPDVTGISLPDNQGPSAAAHAGMRHAYEKGFDWLWMFDDDAFPEPDALELAWDTARRVQHGRVGMIWLPFNDFGGWLWRGRKIPVSVRQRSRGYREPFCVDQVDLNMTLVARDVVTEVGYPREDFFIMLWSCEYCLRVVDAGFSIWVAPRIVVEHQHAGSEETGIWRSYYQTRNQLVMALQRRSIRELFWWLVRQGRFILGTLLHHDRKRERIGLRLRGVRDGLRGRMGKTIDPADYVDRTSSHG